MNFTENFYVNILSISCGLFDEKILFNFTNSFNRIILIT